MPHSSQGSTAARTPLDLIERLAMRVRADILRSTTAAGSGHPTSSLSATDLMCGLLFGGTFRFFVDRPDHPNNDRLIFSKGHASPLFYALWAAAGVVSDDDLLAYRQFDSVLEGHPSVRFPYTEAATGSLGQGLSIGVGMAVNARQFHRLPYRTYVLLGDGEMAEGSQWEAMLLAAHLHLDNLVGILDVNRLGQQGPTMFGHDLSAYERRISAFGWKTIVIDGHSLDAVVDAFEQATHAGGRPVMIIARTVKGRGVSFLEDQDGWHGKALSEHELGRALAELSRIDRDLHGRITLPEDLVPQPKSAEPVGPVHEAPDAAMATREAFGRALVRLAPAHPDMVVLDGEVSNSTGAAAFADKHPNAFIQGFIAEQNMVGMAIGLARRGRRPVVTTFAAFLTRAFDQIRMGQYSNAHVTYVGSHAGVAIGPDGPSQMGLEDIALFRTIEGSVVVHPADAVATGALFEILINRAGTNYLRTMRQTTPAVYPPGTSFRLGGCHVLRHSGADRMAIVAAGAALHEALAAWEMLDAEQVPVRVIDLYCIKPIDQTALLHALDGVGAVLTVEDHRPEGGVGEAVRSAVASADLPVRSLAVRQRPRSGDGAALMNFEGISRQAIARVVRNGVARS